MRRLTPPRGHIPVQPVRFFVVTSLRAGLPAALFRSDGWPGVTDNRPPW
jgi:hypothetical protein